MKNKILLFTTAWFILSLVFTSCHTSKPAATHKPVGQKEAPRPVSRKSGRQPKFIDNIYMDHHSKNSATANAIQPKIKPEKNKPVSRQYDEPEIVIASNAPKETYIKETYIIREPRPARETYPNEVTNVLSKKYADILGVKPKLINNNSLYGFIDKWYGANYRLGGCDKSGIDCSGFAQKLYGDVYGIDLVRTSIEQFKNCKRIKHSKDAVEGDLVFFHANRGKRVSHVGIYLINDYFVHASTTNGVMISNLKEEYWQKSFAGIGRLPGATAQ